MRFPNILYRQVLPMQARDLAASDGLFVSQPKIDVLSAIAIVISEGGKVLE
jgi:hypothetical protein